MTILKYAIWNDKTVDYSNAMFNYSNSDCIDYGNSCSDCSDYSSCNDYSDYSCSCDDCCACDD